MAIGVIEATMAALPLPDRDAIGKWFVRMYGNEISMEGAPDLSADERHVLRLAAEGLTSIGMAGRLGCSARTVEKRLDVMRDKLGANNRVDLVVKAMRWGML